ncbi:MAG: hypothetical protein JXB35_03970 [Anaerolineae bacterium]|nr:hypothetical protein [Anaerolineae bacterium]
MNSDSWRDLAGKAGILVINLVNILMVAVALTRKWRLKKATLRLNLALMVLILPTTGVLVIFALARSTWWSIAPYVALMIFLAAHSLKREQSAAEQPGIWPRMYRVTFYTMLLSTIAYGFTQDITKGGAMLGAAFLNLLAHWYAGD